MVFASGGMEIPLKPYFTLQENSANKKTESNILRQFFKTIAAKVVKSDENACFSCKTIKMKA